MVQLEVKCLSGIDIFKCVTCISDAKKSLIGVGLVVQDERSGIPTLDKGKHTPLHKFNLLQLVF